MHLLLLLGALAAAGNPGASLDRPEAIVALLSPPDRAPAALRAAHQAIVGLASPAGSGWRVRPVDRPTEPQAPGPLAEALGVAALLWVEPGAAGQVRLVAFQRPDRFVEAHLALPASPHGPEGEALRLRAEFLLEALVSGRGRPWPRRVKPRRYAPPPLGPAEVAELQLPPTPAPLTVPPSRPPEAPADPRLPKKDRSELRIERRPLPPRPTSLGGWIGAGALLGGGRLDPGVGLGLAYGLGASEGWLAAESYPFDEGHTYTRISAGVARQIGAWGSLRIEGLGGLSLGLLGAGAGSTPEPGARVGLVAGVGARLALSDRLWLGLRGAFELGSSALRLRRRSGALETAQAREQAFGDLHLRWQL